MHHVCLTHSPVKVDVKPLIDGLVDGVVLVADLLRGETLLQGLRPVGWGRVGGGGRGTGIRPPIMA